MRKMPIFQGFEGIFYVLKIVVFISDVGVLKTKNGSSIFNNRLSWFIYTPTEKFKNYQENQYFFVLYNNFIKYRPQYRKTSLKSTLPISSHPIQNPNSNHFLPI